MNADRIPDRIAFLMALAIYLSIGALIWREAGDCGYSYLARFLFELAWGAAWGLLCYLGWTGKLKRPENPMD